MTTVKLPELRWALKDSLPFCDLKDPRKELNALWLRAGGSHLVVSATDRFTMARIRIEAVDPEPMSLWVDGNAVKQLLPSLVGDTAKLKSAPDRLVIEAPIGELSLPLHPEPSTWPSKEGGLFTGPLPEEGRRATGFTIDLIRRLPRPDGAKSTSIQYPVGKHTLFTDNRKNPRWAVAVMPLSLNGSPDEMFDHHLDAWKDLS